MSDVLIVFDSLVGESTDAEYPESVAVLDWHWGGSRAVLNERGRRSSDGPPEVQDFFFTFLHERMSGLLFNAMLFGKVIEKVTLHQRRAGGPDAQEFLTLDFKNVMVRAVTMVHDHRADALPHTDVLLGFEHVMYKYVQQTDVGGGKGPVVWTFDLVDSE